MLSRLFLLLAVVMLAACSSGSDDAASSSPVVDSDETTRIGFSIQGLDGILTLREGDKLYKVDSTEVYTHAIDDLLRPLGEPGDEHLDPELTYITVHSPSGRALEFSIDKMPDHLECSVENGVVDPSTTTDAVPTITCTERLIAATITGYVSDLNGMLILNINGHEVEISNNGTHPIEGALNAGDAYKVVIQSFPDNPTNQNCAVSFGEGIAIAGNNNDFTVSCGDTGDNLALGGRVSGLVDGTTLDIVVYYGNPISLDPEERIKAMQTLVFTSDMDFEFIEKFAPGSQYLIEVSNQPRGQFCRINKPTGYVLARSADEIVISCAMLPGTTLLGGTVNNLNGVLVLDDGFDPITLSDDGRFYFTHLHELKQAFHVVASSQPDGQFCFVAPSSGKLLNDARNLLGVNCLGITDNLSLALSVTGLNHSAAVKLRLVKTHTRTGEAASEEMTLGQGLHFLRSDFETGDLFELEVVENPDGISCDIVSPYGQFRDVNIGTPVVECAPRKIEGVITASSNVIQDWDVNDPDSDYKSNDDLANVQAVTSSSVVHGFISSAGTQAAGHFFANHADDIDLYELEMLASQRINLEARASGDDPSQNALNIGLYLYDAESFELVDYSNDIQIKSFVQVSRAGRYLVEIKAYGAFPAHTVATYRMFVNDAISAANTPSGTVAATSSLEFATGEAIVTYIDSTSSATAPSATSPSAFSTTTRAAPTHTEQPRARLERFPMSRAASSSRMTASSASISTPTTDQSGTSDHGMLKELSSRNADAFEKRNTLENIKHLNMRADVKHASPNYIVRPMKIPNDPLFDRQWHYDHINLTSAWDITTGDSPFGMFWLPCLIPDSNWITKISLQST